MATDYLLDYDVSCKAAQFLSSNRGRNTKEGLIKGLTALEVPEDVAQMLASVWKRDGLSKRHWSAQRTLKWIMDLSRTV